MTGQSLRIYLVGSKIELKIYKSIYIYSNLFQSIQICPILFNFIIVPEKFKYEPFDNRNS